MISLKIPESDYPGLAALLALTSDAMAELLSALGEAPPISDAQELTATISAKTKAIAPDVAPILAKIAISLNYGRALLDYSIPDFAKAICDAMEATGLETLKLSGERARFESDLIKLLSVESLSASIKAQTVLNEYEHVVCNTRLLTDLRPIFGSGKIETPVGMGIVHTLRIRYHEGETMKEFFVAMDSDELEELTGTLERAREKEKSLQSFLERAGIPEIKT